MAETLQGQPRLDTAQRTLEDAGEEAFDRLARLATKVLVADHALVTLLGDRRSFFDSTYALGQHVVTTQLPLVIEDMHQHPVPQERGVADDKELGSYLGVPLVAAGDHVVGSVCVYGPSPRAWTESEIETLHDIARMAVELVESRHAIRTYQEREATNRLLLNQVPTASAHIDLDGIFRVANRRFTRFLGYADDALNGTVAAQVVQPSELEAMMELHRTVLLGDVAEAEMPTRLLHKDGEIIPATLRWVIVRSAAGAAQYSLLTIMDDRRALRSGRA